jgi:hypothetical protein
MAAATAIYKTLDINEMSQLCSSDGPCLTLYLPPHRPGDTRSGNAARLKAVLQNATDAPEAILNPVRELASLALFESGGPALAVFSRPGNLSMYRLDRDPGEKLHIGSRPFIQPLLAEALVSRTVFILGLSRKQVRLWRFQHPDCEEIGLPPKVPGNITEAGGFDAPDHVLANRSSAGSSTGAMGGVRFTTSSDRESAPEYLHHFFTLLDRGISPLLHDAPLLLAGVAEEVAAYRKASRYPNILEGKIDGAPDILTPPEVGLEAHAAAMAEYRRRGETVFSKYKEMTERQRTAQGIDRVAAAAAEGRVHQAIVAAGNNDDRLNGIAVDTIRTGGQVFELSEQQMGEHSPAAAVLRY